MSKVSIENHTLHKYEKESSKLRLGGLSWTINMDHIMGKEINDVIYETSKHIYCIDLAEAKQHGTYRTLGGERKLCVPLKRWITYKK